MATMQDRTQDDAAFSDAYAEDEAPAPIQTDDDAFGLTPPAEDGPAEGGEGPAGAAPAVAIVVAPGQEGGEDESQYPQSPDEAIAASDEPNDAEQGEMMTAEQIDAEKNRLRSWEGRLKARDPEMKYASGAPDMQDSDPNEANESAAEEAGESNTQELGEMEAEKLEGMSHEDALAALKADFGDEFTNMLLTIIRAEAGKASEGVSQNVNDIINDIVDSKAKAHFEYIADRHPDFMDVADSPEFKSYIDGLPDEAKAEAQQVIDSGSARQICALLAAFKARNGAEDPTMDAAEGVRSTGLRLPQQPAASGDYEAAWDAA